MYTLLSSLTMDESRVRKKERMKEKYVSYQPAGKQHARYCNDGRDVSYN